MSATVSEDNIGIFTREVEIESLKTSLKFYQKEIGDVSCVIWDASLVLAHYIERRAVQNQWPLEGKKVIELGAGVGCVGILTACFGANVIMTDLPAVLPLLERNIQENMAVWSKSGGCASASELSWGEAHNLQPPDLMLLADCVYYTESVVPLVETMKQLSSKDTEIIICQEKRDSEKQQAVWKQFTLELDKYFTFVTIPTEDQHTLFSSPDILLMKGFRSNM